MIKVKEMLQALELAKQPEERLELLNKLTKLLVGKDPVMAKSKANELLELSTQLDNKEHIANAHLYLGNIYYNTLELDNAEVHFQKAIDTYPTDADVLCMPRAKMALGLLQWTRGDHTKALETYMPLLDVELDDSYDQLGFRSDLLTNIGNVYAHKGQYDLCETYYVEALALLDDAELIDEGLHIRANIASLEASKGNFEEAVEQYEICLEGFKRVGNKTFAALVVVNLASAYCELKLYANSLEMFQQGLKMFKGMEDDNTVVTVLAGISKVYLGLKGYDDSIKYANKAITLASTIGFPAGILDALLAKSRAYIGSNDLVNAERVYNEAKALAKEKGLKMDFPEQEHFNRAIDQ